MKRELALAYARRVQHLMLDPRSLEALEVAERYDTATASAIEFARGEAQQVGDITEENTSAYYAGDVAFALLLPDAGHALDAVASSARHAVAKAAFEACTAAQDAERAAWKAEHDAQQKLTVKCSSLFTIAFSVEHADPSGSDITPEMLRDAMQKRWDDLYLSGEWDEAVEGPFGTEEKAP